MKTTNALLDAGAIALSSLCLLHCTALPLLAAALPLMGCGPKRSGYIVFVAIAAPTTGFALWRAHRQQPLPPMAIISATAGLLCFWRAQQGGRATTPKPP